MSKIEKRYQLFGSKGIEWSPWFVFNMGYKSIDKLEPWQLDYKLKNEYRKIDANGIITPIKLSYKVSNKVNTKSK